MLLVMKVVAGCITSCWYSGGMRCEYSSQPLIVMSAVPLPSETWMSQSWLLGVTPVRRK